jgi:hypothetical protein
MAHASAPMYTWVCQYCERSSPGGTLTCASCGFPAHTTAQELERAKQLGSVTAFLAEKQTTQGNWRRKTRFKKVVVVVSVPLFAAGFILLRFAWGWRNMALGAAMLSIALFCLWLGR